MKTNNLILLVVLLVLLLVSCKERVRNELRPLQANYTYSVVYNKDSIVIEEQNDGKKHAEPLVLFLSNGEYYFTVTVTGPCFQSDYADGSNKWIPFGMLDNALNTATFHHTTITDDEAHAYDVKPNNDYFLNCYWDK